MWAHFSRVALGEECEAKTTAPVRALDSLLAHRLAAARSEPARTDDLLADAGLLSTTVVGLIQGILAGHTTAESAERMLRRQVELLTETSRPAQDLPS
jgi:hypothetical protein